MEIISPVTSSLYSLVSSEAAGAAAAGADILKDLKNGTLALGIASAVRVEREKFLVIGCFSVDLGITLIPILSMQ